MTPDDAARYRAVAVRARTAADVLALSVTPDLARVGDRRGHDLAATAIAALHDLREHAEARATWAARR